MSDSTKPEPGAILWRDLTVPDAAAVRDFYAGVVGWTFTEHPMGEYTDYNMLTPSGTVAAGICNKLGPNADVPSQWLMYITVEDVDASAARCAELGGEVVVAPRQMGGGTFAVIRDPAGAMAALYSMPQSES